MSTKIYTGFKVDAGSTQASIARLSALKPCIQELVEEKGAKVFVALLAKRIDDYCEFQARQSEGDDIDADTVMYWQDHKDDDVWVSCWLDLAQQQKECRHSQQRNPDIDCDVELFLRLDPQTGALLGYLQEERVGAFNALCRAPDIVEYRYWNNTDRPESVNEEDWVARGQAWERVLTNESLCFCVRFEPQMTFVDFTHIARLLPTFEQRVQNRAARRLKLETIRQWSSQQSNPRSSEMLRLLRDLSDALNDPQSAHSQRLAQLERWFSQILPLDLEGFLRGRFSAVRPRTQESCR